jgi:protein-tyrosine phosphatase
MRAILDAIDAATSDGHVVYFHCWGGHGRTGTVAGCYMVRHGSTPQDALDAIKRLREGSLTAHRASPERGAQTEMVLNWQELDERTASPDGR